MNIDSSEHSPFFAGYWHSVDAAILALADKEEIQQCLAGMASLIEVNISRKNAIAGDGMLSDAGRDVKFRALIEESDANLETIVAPVITKLEEQITSAERAIASATTAAASPGVVETMRAIEIRAAAAAMNDQLGVETRMKMLAMSGDDDFAALALITASPFLNLARPSEVARAQELMASRLLPDRTVEIEAARETLSTVRNAERTAKGAFAVPIERARLGIGDELSMRALAGVTTVFADAPGA